MDGCFPVSEQRSLYPPNRYPYILQLSPASWSASEPPDRLVGEATGLGKMISCSKQMAHFAQNGIFFFFFSAQSGWMLPVGGSLKLTQAGIAYLYFTITWDLLFDCIDLKRRFAGPNSFKPPRAQAQPIIPLLTPRGCLQ